MNKLMLIIVVLVVFVGCDKIVPKPQPISSYEFTDVVVSALAAHSASLTPVPDPDINPDPEKHSRANCPTGGWVTHGDGHRTRCPDCDPPWTGMEDVQAELSRMQDEFNRFAVMQSEIQTLTAAHAKQTESMRLFVEALDSISKSLSDLKQPTPTLAPVQCTVQNVWDPNLRQWIQVKTCK